MLPEETLQPALSLSLALLSVIDSGSTAELLPSVNSPSSLDSNFQEKTKPFYLVIHVVPPTPVQSRAVDYSISAVQS
ncbi:MAG: hypothetical protein J3R72DRAFT_440411 [Linnemannia gamsii]|nr:MAG: hypothetical protein J3R72DRAFT_440411 [Linnemannia gamsii]